MVANREEKYYLCKQKGYEIPTFICKDAHVYTNDIGDGVIIYPNVTIGPCVKVGKGCFFDYPARLHIIQKLEILIFLHQVLQLGVL